MAKSMVEKEDLKTKDDKSDTVLIVEEENKEEQENNEKSRHSSIAWSIGSNPFSIEYRTGGFRSFKRRSSTENFGQFGLLTPALALFPLADGADALTKQFGYLQGEHRELKLAAAHIDDALTGRGSYGKARSYFKPWLAKRCFDILNNPWFQRLMVCNILMHSLAIFFEPPSVKVASVNPVVLAINLSCILLYLFDLGVKITFLTWPVFWSRKAEAGAWNGVQFVFVCMFIFDCAMLLVSSFTDVYLPQCFRCFRPAVILYKVRNIRHIFNVLIALVAKLGKLFFIIFVFILVSACVGVHVFMEEYSCNGPLGNINSTTTHHGKEVPCFITEKEKDHLGAFNNVAYAMLRLFVLLSTENYPEVMIPSMRSQPTYFFFFGIYVFVGVFFLTAILLAIVVDNYWDSSKKHVKKERATERAELAKAWNLLDPLGKGALSITDEKFIQLFNILKPKNSTIENLYLIELLDSNEDGEVDSFEWTTMLSQVLSCEFEDESSDLYDESQDLDKWHNRIRDLAGAVTESLFFARFILVLLIIHCLLFTLKWVDEPPEADITVQVLKTVIVTVFVAEVIMRVTVLGKRILDPLELTDLALVVIAFCSNLVWYINYPNFFWFRNYATVISCLAVFCRLPFNSSQLKNAIEIFISVAPVMVDLMCLLGIIMYLLSTVGMELFHSVKFDKHMYLPVCGLGFNNFWCSCLILFQLLTTSNWHEIMNQTMTATQNPWYSLYFVLCFIFVNMIVMNLFVAIAIEAFNKLVVSDSEHGPPPLTRSVSEPPPQPFGKNSMTKQAVQVLNDLGSSILGSARAEQVVERERRKSLTFTGQSAIRRGSRRGSQILRLPSETSLQSEDGPGLGGIDEDSEEEDSDDNSNSRKGDKRERMLKKRMKMKKKKKKKKKEAKDALEKLNSAEYKVRVVTAFRASKDNDLDLTVGDEVTVLLQKDDWWKGKCKNKIGWFPASHVILRTLKAIPEYDGNRNVQLSGEKNAEDANGNEFVLQVSTDSSHNPLRLPSGDNNPLFHERVPANLAGSPPAVRSRMKIKKTGDWRRDILGEMTVMNAEELRELNNIMRAELRTPTGLRSKRANLLSSLEENNSVFEEQEFMDNGQGGRPNSSQRPFSSHHSPRFPRNAVGPLGRRRTESTSSVGPLGRLRTESTSSVGPLRSLRTESTSSTGPLGSLRTESCSSVESFRGRQNSNSSGFGEKSRTGSTNSWARPSQSQQVPIVEFVSPGTPTIPDDGRPPTPDPALLNVKKSPAPIKAKKKAEKTKNGEMPDWMVNFVTSKNLTVGEDVKLDETKASNRRRRSSTATGPGTGTNSTGTGSKSKAKPGKGSRSPRAGTGATKSKPTGATHGGDNDEHAKKNVPTKPGGRKTSTTTHRKSVV